MFGNLQFDCQLGGVFFLLPAGMLAEIDIIGQYEVNLNTRT